MTQFSRKFLLDCFLASLGCVSVSITLGNILEFLSLKLGQSRDSILINSFGEIENLIPLLEQPLNKWGLLNLLLGPSSHVEDGLLFVLHPLNIFCQRREFSI